MTKTTTTLRIERVFDATPEEVWAAWTDPVQYAQWLNPAPGIDLVIHEFDVRPGGRMRFDMPQPDGNKHPQEGVFHSLTPYRELVSGSEDKSFLLTARFEPVGKQTRLSVEVIGVPPEYHGPATQGWNAGLDKLGAVLASGATRTLRLERTFDCTPQEMWAAWTRPEELARWFGPFHLDNEVTELDVRVGGNLKNAMVDEEGKRYPITGAFLIVDEPNELAFTAGANEIGGHISTVRVRFRAVGRKTAIIFEQCGLPADVTDDTGEGWSISWDKLEAGLGAKEREIVITRTIDAAQERIFQAYTDPEQVGKWWGPNGFTLTTHEMDVRPGGLWRFDMHGPDGTDYPNWVRYEEITPPRRLVYAQGGDGPESDPLFHTFVTLHPVGAKTLLRHRLVFPTKEARDHVGKEYGAIKGGEETIARLEAHVRAG